MIEGPTREELVKATVGWLNDTSAPVSGFHRKVAANALGIVAREMEQWPAAEAAAVQRMQAILGREGNYKTLNADLARALREGSVDGNDPAVFEHLRRSALDMLAIDQPRYRHELSTGDAE